MPSDDELKDPFMVEPADSGPTSALRPANAATAGGLRDPFARETTPLPPGRPLAPLVPSFRLPGAEAASAQFDPGPEPTLHLAPAAPQPAAGTPPTAMARPAPADDEFGRELTMQGMAAFRPSPAPAADDFGRELTMQGMPAMTPPPSATATPYAADDLGRELTMPGMAAMGTPPPAASDDFGREMTMQGMAAMATPPPPSAGDDLGRELTMPGMSALVPRGAGDELGRESTLQGMAAAAPAPAGDELGREMTMAAMPNRQLLPGLPFPGMAAAGDELGRESTMRTLSAATPAPGTGEHRPGTSVTAIPDNGRPRTRGAGTSAFDNSWHLEGRRGPHTGQVWGDWEIGGILGEGGMGAVYRARQRSLKRRVALKVLAPNLAADANLLSRFQLEARMTSALSSPNIVAVYAAGEWGDNHFFVMEYVEGTDLYDVLQKRKAESRPFSPDEAADIIIQAGKGLAEAGRHGIVHRDIKPPNLMVTKGGLVKVADFGIVKVMGESSLTMAGQAVGTPSYVSPEQGRGQADIDQRSDLYSLGVVYYELLCGKKPFEGSTPNALIYQHCYAEPELPRTLNPAISEEYQAVILRCLQKKPENRYQSADELVKDLEDIRNGNLLKSAMANYKLGTGADEAQRENMSWAQRHLLPLAAAVALVVLGGGGLGLMWYNGKAAERAAQVSAELEVARLRDTLKDLDKVAPLPAKAEQVLSELAKAIPNGDADPGVLRWRSKVKRVRALETRLAGLDQEIVPAAVRITANPDLLAYQGEVGTGDAKGVRWAARLDQAARDEQELRAKLGGFDTAALTILQRDALAPLLAQLRTTASDSDPDVVKWTARFADLDQRVARLGETLAPLDAQASVTESEHARFAIALAAIRPLLGEQDERVQRWDRKLQEAQGLVGRLRAAIAERLNKVDRPPLPTQEAVAIDLATLRTLVDAKDADFVRWDAQIKAANVAFALLREKLAAIDAVPTEDTLDAPRIEPMRQWLTELRGLAHPGDPDVIRWDARVRAAQALIDELREALRRLDRDEPIALAEQDTLAAAVSRLDAKAGLDPIDKQRDLARLAAERQRVADLRDSLAGFDRREAISDGMRSGLARFTRDVSTHDVDAKRWQAKLERVDALRAKLALLDSSSPVPADIEAIYRAFVSEVGSDNPEALRWQAKTELVGSTLAALRPLDQVRPLPATCDADLAVLARLVGSDDPSWKRWRAKVDRVGQLKVELGLLPATCGQSPAAHEQAHAALRELCSLVGPEDRDLPGWARRQEELDGPGRPAWASDAGRDAFGLWADLTLKPGMNQRFRFVPGGTFGMGSPEREPGRDGDEIPVVVTLTKACWLAENECTQALWSAVMGSNPSRYQGAERPVERVSWHDAQAFLAKLRAVSGERFAARLPSEAEWERACRAGGDAPYSVADVGSIAWYDGNTSNRAKPVRLRQPNALGLYDLHGNVWEWCADQYAPYSSVPISDPLGRGGDQRCARGGSWGDAPAALRAANRLALAPNLGSVYLGLRVAADATWSTVPDGTRLLGAISAQVARVNRRVELGSPDGVQVVVVMSSPPAKAEGPAAVVETPVVPVAPAPAAAPTQPVDDSALTPVAPVGAPPVAGDAGLANVEGAAVPGASTLPVVESISVPDTPSADSVVASMETVVEAATPAPVAQIDVVSEPTAPPTVSEPSRASDTDARATNPVLDAAPPVAGDLAVPTVLILDPAAVAVPVEPAAPTAIEPAAVESQPSPPVDPASAPAAAAPDESALP